MDTPNKHDILKQALTALRRNGERIQELANTGEDQARWRPDEDSWSVLEVACHLLDEEREDFRPRLDRILHRPDEPWVRIDPQAAVVERRYNEQDLETTLRALAEERALSLDWLAELSDPNWDAEAQAPWGGTVRAGDMLAAWVAHDTLHMRQLVELHRAWSLYRLSRYDASYAGEW